MAKGRQGIPGALVKVGSKALTRLGPGTASLVGTVYAIPVLGPTVSLAVAGFMLGAEALEYIRNARTRNALQRIFSNGDWFAFYEDRASSNDGDAWRQRVFNCLDGLRRTIAFEAVEPIIRLADLVARNQVEWTYARSLVAALKDLTGPEIVTLRIAFKEGLRVLPLTDPIDFFEYLVDDEWVLCAGDKENPHVELRVFADARTALESLTTNGVCVSVRPFKIGGNSPRESDRFGISRERLALLVQLLDG